MPAAQIVDEGALETALAAGRFLLVKHSLTCPISVRAFREVEAFLAAHPMTPSGWIDVIGQRAWARRIAETTGVSHESPQALWIRDGRVAWSASHHSITRASLAAATAE